MGYYALKDFVEHVKKSKEDITLQMVNGRAGKSPTEIGDRRPIRLFQKSDDDGFFMVMVGIGIFIVKFNNWQSG
jgi:hypothetical protein